ncbi:isochorismatase family cysteine hydrolase [Burkholderia oklahomensis]|uniref:Isochorismatase family protein n=1 Tax=Burkholderia oklahomensis TaxID=342113 RepID=A0AAI8B9V7_9BURK|nr:isochorismatase family cysteine hydrolase [Burkholderia oklahomensis]AIO68868.1 isochorismatase family protein [Burkholderia oklahomensis]AJX36021.1 isochorismatase family protein [Burkholderia oklahomensis C6786]AOI38510.1 isochorismatase [Burkholderia oklahomensis EO147]AOI48227.1 isochorismatase [Burkholderia oklahomensis C6786]KUY48369.1 isochorismatase [Burkholderia oklahomensis EO147]
MKTALIGLDYIVDIMHPTGKIARCAAHAAQRDVVGRFNQALTIARQKDWLRIAVKVGFEPGYADLPAHSPMFSRAKEFGALDLSGPGTALHPDLDADAVQLVVVKPRVSAFYATPLEAALRANRIERVIVTGVSTTWAVQAAARDAHDRDYEVLVLEDACASATQEEHQRSIEMLRGVARIVTIDDLAAL